LGPNDFWFGPAPTPCCNSPVLDSPPPPPILDQPVGVIHGVGLERAAQLARLEIRTVGDLILHAPRRHEDRRHFKAIRDLVPGEPATTRGQVVALGSKKFKKSSRSVVEVIVEDGTGRLYLRWWNLPFMERMFAVGDELFIYGKMGDRKPRSMDHPETEIIEAGDELFIHINRVTPIYPLTEGLPQRSIRGFVWRALGASVGQIPDPYAAIVPPAWPSREDALRQLHFPHEPADSERGRRRLALDEFLDLQIAIQRRRKNLERNATALPCGGDNSLIKPFLAGLGFPLTDAQAKVLKEIRADLGGKIPMRRLLQGDVGAGKTVVANCAALMALESGFNVLIMAPTEILAEQHSRNFRAWLEPLGIPVNVWTGSVKSDARGQLFGSGIRHQESGMALPASAPSLTVGTHALIDGGFSMENVGLVVIDEQHKFGVGQREKLVRKGRYPHLLVMTATPIPRTLGLTLYGDLDVSIIDELPAGRGRIRTYVRSADRLPKVWDFIREKLTEGRQAYVVYSRLEEADTVAGVKAATHEFERLKASFAPHRVGLIHGRMKADEKELVMRAFRANQIQVLLATSVIEVGVDVPNATVMVIENAEQFGLAQLHQLRGRIGRGAHDSFCILVATAKTDAAHQRLKIMEATNDGFRLAEEDLLLRGPGELLGQQQSGLPKLRFGDLVTDRELVEEARGLAKVFLDKEPVR
jgi:ATP-dependent DNA helicase RecG